jgi:uncharacterized membrane-anchored protein YjiN (DUF445 family)
MNSESKNKRMTDKQKRAYTAVIKKLKEQKGITIKYAEMQSDLQDCKDRQKKIVELKQQFTSLPAVQEEADKSYKKLQNIIEDINEYMSILHPAGLLDMGSGTSGKSIVGQG